LQLLYLLGAFGLQLAAAPIKQRLHSFSTLSLYHIVPNTPALFRLNDQHIMAVLDGSALLLSFLQE
jgi:hypothetical protein